MYKFLYALFLAILLGVCVVLGSVWFREYNEYMFYEKERDNAELELNQARKALNHNKSYVKRFQDDQSFMQWVARQKLGYAASDEIVFRFNDEERSSL